MEEKNVFTAKSVDEALDEGLKTMDLPSMKLIMKLSKKVKKDFSV